MAKPVLTPRAAVAEMRTRTAAGQRVGVMFGPERAGLVNEDLAIADAVLSVPLNPAFASLNLGQAVLLLGYEWYQSVDTTPDRVLMDESSPPASVENREFFLGRLEALLDEAGFFYPEHIVPSMKLNLRALFTRAAMSDQEVQTLHGAIRALSEGPRRRSRKDS